MSSSGANQSQAVAAAVASWDTLAAVRSDLPPAQVLERLRTASRRGRLPGFREEPGGFGVDLFGVPWDRELVGTVTPDGAGSVVSWRWKSRRWVREAWAAVLVLSVWPGVVLADQFIPSSWGWLGTHVWHWYVPLTAGSNLWAWVWAVRKTDRTTLASAQEAVASVARELAVQPS
jgi:hypothetical protein